MLSNEEKNIDEINELDEEPDRLEKDKQKLTFLRDLYDYN